MMMAMVRGFDASRCAVLESCFHIGLQLGEGGLRSGKVARAKGLAEGGEVVLNRVVA